jgi:hypothetical protein
VRERDVFLSASLIAVFSLAGIAYGQPNQATASKGPRYSPPTIDHGGLLPAPGVASAASRSPNREALFATYSFIDSGTPYNIEFYYRPLYCRIRARVLVGDRELHGLFNRFYGADPKRNHAVSVVKRRDGCPVVDIESLDALVIKESDVSTDAIYDALEAFLNQTSPQQRGPIMYMDHQPTGLLSKACWIRVFGARGGDYLFHDDGRAAPFTLENLRLAYWQEGIKAQNPVDYERVGRSIITVEQQVTGHGRTLVIASTDEIPEYRSHPLDATKKSEIKAPWLSKSADGQTDFWNWYTYQEYHGVVARYAFGFHEGRLASLEKTILGEGIGRAVYLGGEKRPADSRK